MSIFKSLVDPHFVNTVQVSSPVAKSASPNPNAGSSTSNINGDMYIADGDYIKDIEVNDLRNRYTLTKGSTQKMVNTPVKSTDIPRLLPLKCASGSCDIIFLSLTLVESVSSLRWADIAPLCDPSFASADLHCVTSRLKKKLAPVRFI